MSNTLNSEQVTAAAGDAVLRQLAGALEMLSNAVHACPEHLWQHRIWPAQNVAADFSAFWYVAFHALFWCDLYLEGQLDGFQPPEPFNLDELDPAFVPPPRPYSKDEVLAYLEHCRNKGVTRLADIEMAAALRTSGFQWLPCSYLEVQLYNLRHLQEHIAQLNVCLGQSAGVDTRWIIRGKRD